MIEGLFNQPAYQAAKKLLDVTSLRHEAITSNLANVETPNYKRVDVATSFQAQLRAAVASRDVEAMSSLAPHLEVDLAATATRKDGNTVQLETELLEMSKNSMAHTLETQLITGSLLRMRLAINGRS